MAHSMQVKTQALAMLLTGNSPRYVAAQTGVPLTTVKWWRNVDMPRLLREILPPGFNWRPSVKMALKKEMRQNGTN